MPNWAYSKVTLSGTHSTVSLIKNRLATSYPSPHDPSRVEKGVFLLWNIIKPDNLDTYLEKDNKAFTEIVKADPDLVELDKAVMPEPTMESIVAEVMSNLATGQGWYEWNCRNWGTKWEITDRAVLEYELPSFIPSEPTAHDNREQACLELGYRMESAWSPPVEALDSLAEQYPEITITLSSIDESDCFAMEAQWDRGGRVFDTDVEITHDLGMDLRGYCNLECCNDYE